MAAELAGAALAVDETALADAIDGALGEGSQFHQTFGYYAKGVEAMTATLTPGWRDRLVPLRCQAPHGGVTGWCLEIVDLWVAKAAAGRSKDFEFCGALARAGLVRHHDCSARVEHLAGIDLARARSVVRRSWSPRGHHAGLDAAGRGWRALWLNRAQGAAPGPVTLDGSCGTTVRIAHLPAARTRHHAGRGGWAVGRSARPNVVRPYDALQCRA